MMMLMMLRLRGRAACSEAPQLSNTEPYLATAASFAALATALLVEAAAGVVGSEEPS